MPKLNTLFAAALAATTMITPVSAGQPGAGYGSTVHPGGYVAQSAGTYSGATSSSYSSSYASSGATGYSTSYTGGYAPSGVTGYTAGLPNVSMTSTGPVSVTADEIVCMMGNQEVPCDSIPGLTEALRAQGMGSIAHKV